MFEAAQSPAKHECQQTTRGVSPPRLTPIVRVGEEGSPWPCRACTMSFRWTANGEGSPCACTFSAGHSFCLTPNRTFVKSITRAVIPCCHV